MTAKSSQLRVLVAATLPWSVGARLAAELKASGCIVEAVAPRRSPLHRIAAVQRSYVLGLFNPVGSLRQAIESSAAELIIPIDDRTCSVLHCIHAGADPTTEAGARLRRRLERSLGPPELYSRLYSRIGIMEIATECGVRRPATDVVESADDITRWLGRHPGPAVLKTDGSWGGRGTRVIRTAADGRAAWRRLSRPTGLARCVKRALVETDPWSLRARLTGDRPQVTIQAYIDGIPGNAAVACLDGTVLGVVQAEVVRTNGPTGPSTAVRVVEHPEMLAAATAIVDRLQMSGLVGLDFILEGGTGRAHLIEINPRATPTAHLMSADGTDLLASLRAALGHAGPPSRTASYPDGLVALFPGELLRDSSSELLDGAYHDVPWHAPDLVAHELGSIRSADARNLRGRLAGLAETLQGSSSQPVLLSSAEASGTVPRAGLSPDAS